MITKTFRPRKRVEEAKPARPSGGPARPSGGDDLVRFVALGGLEEVGRNMVFFEYNDEIVIIDMGLQFPEEDTPGIDFIIPNINYLVSKKDKIKAIIITHAHYDHIGAIPYLIGKLGNPPIYCAALTKQIILKRQEEFRNAPKLDIEVIKNWEEINLSKYFSATFFGIAHNIPDATAVILKTPIGNIVHSGDFKIDYDEKDNPLNLDEFKMAGAKNILALIIDSTNAEEPGHSLSEKKVEKTLEGLFKKAPGRIIVATFASLLNRIAEIIKITERLDRKIAISGLSMKNNIQIAQNLGYIKIKKGAIISLEEIHKYRDEKIMILSTGAQGEPNASLMRIANGEHKHIQIKPTDTVILSSSVIPGNERSVQVLKDNLSRQGAKVYHSKLVDIHSSGHAPKDDLQLAMKLIKPKFVIPAMGYYFMRAANAELTEEIGIPRKNIILIDNGQVIEIKRDSIEVTDERVDAYYVMVDGLGVGDVGEVVMRDRRVLAQEGMVVIIATLDRHSGRFLKNPDIISRGFIYLRENKELVEEVRKKIKGLISRIPRHQTVEPDYVKALMRDQVGRFLYNKTKRRPMILPVIIEV